MEEVKKAKYDSYYMPPKEELKEVIKEAEPEDIVPLENPKSKKELWKEKMNAILDSINSNAGARKYGQISKSVKSAKQLLEEL